MAFQQTCFEPYSRKGNKMDDKHALQKMVDDLNKLALKYGHKEKITIEDAEKLWFEKSGDRCWFCSRDLVSPGRTEWNVSRLTHLRSVKGPGKNVYSNLRFACERCIDIKMDSSNWYFGCSASERCNIVQAGKNKSS